MKPANTWPRIRHFYDSGLWTEEQPLRGSLRRWPVRILRVAVVAARASQDGLLNLHAVGLVYSTLLSLVPFLAVTFSVLKAFGAHYRLEPLVARMLAPLGPQGAELAGTVVEFVSRMSVGVLGAVGLAGLFYTALSLIGRIEDALNHIWNVRRSRALRRKFSDYLSVLLVGPVLVFAAFALIASLRSWSLVQRVLQITRLETVTISVAGHVMPFLLLASAFTFLYRFLPYTRVRLDAAVVGGVTAAVLWQLAGVAFAGLVAGSASYAAIYSSFAVLVLSLIWLQVAWLVVLIGGQVAYADQHPASYAAARLPHGLLFRERVGLAALTEITRRYLSGQPAYRLDELSRATDAPQTTLEELVDVFVARGILVRASDPESVVLSHPPEQFLVVDLLHVIRDPASVDARTPEARVNAVSDVLHRRDEALRSALGEVTLRSLAAATQSRRTVTDLAQHRRREVTG
jgi:membrane protein